MMGLPKSVLTTGFEFPVLGVPLYTSTTLAAVDNSFRGILAHKEWQALVQQIKLEYKTESRLGDLVAADLHFWHTLYGVGQIRSTYAVNMFIRRTRSKQ